MATILLDLVGLKCPWPAMRTKKALAALQIGDRLDVRCTDPMAAIDIPHLVNITGNRLVESARGDDGLSFLIEKAVI
jgi:tRNA 2-thiouridine synthesizing protein A